MTLDIEKLKKAALDSVAVFADSKPVRDLITQLEETKADLAHANSIIIKIEKLIEGVEYRGDYAEGVRVLVAQQAAVMAKEKQNAD